MDKDLETSLYALQNNYYITERLCVKQQRTEGKVPLHSENETPTRTFKLHY